MISILFHQNTLILFMSFFVSFLAEMAAKAFSPPALPLDLNGHMSMRKNVFFFFMYTNKFLKLETDKF